MFFFRGEGRFRGGGSLHKYLNHRTLHIFFRLALAINCIKICLCRNAIYFTAYRIMVVFLTACFVVFCFLGRRKVKGRKFWLKCDCSVLGRISLPGVSGLCEGRYI